MVFFLTLFAAALINELGNANMYQVASINSDWLWTLKETIKFWKLYALKTSNGRYLTNLFLLCFLVKIESDSGLQNNLYLSPLPPTPLPTPKENSVEQTINIFCSWRLKPECLIHLHNRLKAKALLIFSVWYLFVLKLYSTEMKNSNSFKNFREKYPAYPSISPSWNQLHSVFFRSFLL